MREGVEQLLQARGSTSRLVACPGRSPMATHTEITDNSFDEEILGSDKPVLVDFWAEWCGPCKMIAPILDEIADERSEDLRIVKLNVDDNIRTAQRFEVMSIPTLMLFKDGEVQLRVVGAKSKSALLADLEPHL
jgi:thioredoxin 1